MNVANQGLKSALLMSVMCVALTACGGGGGSSSDTPAPATNSGSVSPSSGSSPETGGASTPVANAALYNVDGYAALGTAVTGGGVVAETDATYKKVTTPAEFIAAITAAKIGTKPAVKVIEVMNDLKLGTLESGVSITGPYRAQSTQAQMHPDLKLTGMSLIDIQKIDGLTIFSRNGAKILHGELNLKDVNNVIIRNLTFDEAWEWDEATKGNYDKNDWDYITLGDGTAATKVWIDHCTFYKAYDGIVDIKGGSSGVTISWSQILGGSSNPNFIKHQMDYLEANRASNAMYNYLRGFLSQDQITQISSTVKKGHLIGATEFAPENATLQVTLHHNYYKDLQDRMPRLRGGDVQVFNIFADSTNARTIKTWYDNAVSSNPTLSGKLTDSGPTYHFGITSNGTISTEDGVIEVDNSLYVGVLTPLRNNQSDVTNAAYTGSVIARNTQHELPASDMPVASQQSTYTQDGVTWAIWKGKSSDTTNTLGPIQATTKVLSFKNAPPTKKFLHEPTALRNLLRDGAEPAGANKISMTVTQWENSNN